MPEFTITCGRCKAPVSHVCGETFQAALMSLLTWVPGGYFASEEIAAAFKAESERQQDDYDFAEHPFFGSQAWTYLIWRKEDARTFHALLNNVMRASGIDPYEMGNIASKKAHDRLVEEHQSRMGACLGDIKIYTRRIEGSEDVEKIAMYQQRIEQAKKRLAELEIRFAEL